MCYCCFMVVNYERLCVDSLVFKRLYPLFIEEFLSHHPELVEDDVTHSVAFYVLVANYLGWDYLPYKKWLRGYYE